MVKIVISSEEEFRAMLDEVQRKGKEAFCEETFSESEHQEMRERNTNELKEKFREFLKAQEKRKMPRKKRKCARND